MKSKFNFFRVKWTLHNNNLGVTNNKLLLYYALNCCIFFSRLLKSSGYERIPDLRSSVKIILVNSIMVVFHCSLDTDCLTLCSLISSCKSWNRSPNNLSWVQVAVIYQTFLFCSVFSRSLTCNQQILGAP